MKIGVNARFLTKPYTGIGQYTEHLYRSMAERFPDFSFFLVVPEKVEVHFPPNVEIIVAPEPLFGTSGIKKTWWEQVVVPKILKKKRVDILHFPYPSNPWFGSKIPVAVTVHDTIPWETQAYRASILTRLYQDMAKGAVKKAQMVLTVSGSSNADIIRVCQIDATKIKVIENGISPGFLKDERARLPEIRHRYGLQANRPYFLYAGGFDERKNIPRLVEAFSRVVAKNSKIDLVLVGGKHLQSKLYSSYEKLKEKSEKQQHHGKLIFTGFVPEHDLVALYQGAYSFVNFSLQEGFNLPLLQAAVSHLPLLTSDLPVHRELLGDQAIYCDPFSVDSMAKEMLKIFLDQGYYRLYREKISDFAPKKSWDDGANILAKIFEDMRTNFVI